MRILMAVIALLVRLLLALMFLGTGMEKILHFAANQKEMAAHGMGLTGPLLLAAIGFELLGGLSLLLGYKTRWGASALIFFLIPVTLIFHNVFAHPPEPDAVQGTLINVVIMGILALLAVYGPGRFSLDGWRARPPRNSVRRA